MARIPSKATSKRREFLVSLTAVSVMLMKPSLIRGTAANSAIGLGVLGCGGRANQIVPGFLNNTPSRIVAIADLFQDKLVAAKKRFDEISDAKGYSEIDRSQVFRGPKAYEDIIASKGVDAVLVTTPAYFHPDHLEAAVRFGKHVYLEKPVAVDVHGAKRVVELGEQAQDRLSLDVGFEIRNAPVYMEMVQKIHGGALGEIVCGDGHAYFPAINLPSWPSVSIAERRIRNWIYDRVLSGDILVEQDIHAIDVCNWILQSHPIKASGTGGRKTPTHPDEDTWDHYNLTFSYPQSIHLSFTATKFDKGYWDVCERFFGLKGISESHYTGGVRIYGEQPWDSGFGGAGRFWHGMSVSPYAGALKNCDAEKQKAFISSIISGKFHNQTAQGVESTLSAILGREAAYAQREITWDELLSSDEAWYSGIDLNQFA